MAVRRDKNHRGLGYIESQRDGRGEGVRDRKKAKALLSSGDGNLAGAVLVVVAIHLFYFIITPNFPPSLNVLIFSAILASDVLTIKIRY